MVSRLNQSDPDFEDRFRALLAAKREVSEDVEAVARGIIEDVRARGDAALVEHTGRFDRIELTPATLRIPEAEFDAAEVSVTGEARDALRFAKQRIEDFHRRQMPADDHYADDLGVELGMRWTAIEAVGLYVPGGTAAYPSSVLMNAVPARVAGVERIVLTVPTPDGRTNPLVLVAARLAGIDEVYRVGGAQAVAALAYGTGTIAPVAKIVGPGNAYVAAAKRLVFGQVGIDMIAGASEVLVVADGDNDADWIASDLLAQAEHDTAAQSILVTDSEDLAERVASAVGRQLATLPRGEVAAASWRDHGAIILVDSLAAGVALSNRVAPEHLELAVADPEALLVRVRNAGSVFLGRHTPEVIGDYVGGPNHVLPTARSARFSSGLSVFDFVKRTTLLKLGPEQLRALGPAAITLAEAEGLDAHARSVSIRMNR
ncbi:MAG: histidinol dehydrogenase [Bauldia sp.]|uniref:histidinol dehydrogenase n=1 Tax=Bauldia sp. TaxID=2575872 RepID=UPI001D9528DB|nr:histidinol dehydrogenase [Bauldia sp.]MCB1494404.1 histidinol dehydrogenase [Bauldia sp.]